MVRDAGNTSLSKHLTFTPCLRTFNDSALLRQRRPKYFRPSPYAKAWGLLHTEDEAMLLGIDYGTTRTVVATVDRGNYPVVSFHTASGDTQEWYPSLVAARGDKRLYGLDAAARQDDAEWLLIRSFKRQLTQLGPESRLALGTGSVTALELLTEFLSQLRRDLCERSNLRVTSPQDFEAMISVRYQHPALPDPGSLQARRLSGARAVERAVGCRH
jgi:hypothetical protein